MSEEARWRVVAEDKTRRLARYLTEHEPAATVMSEKLKADRLDRRLRRGGRFYILSDEQLIRAAVYHGPGGFFCPSGVAAYEERGDLLQGLRKTAGSFLRIHSIMGTRTDVDALATLFGAHARTAIDYELLSIEPDRMPLVETPPIDSLTLIRAEERHWKQLLPLQIAYEIEEVLPPGTQPNIAHSKGTLYDSLKNHTVLIAIKDNEAIARVATNAHGYRGEQIGGVYTDPRYRGRGIARWLMTELLAVLERENRFASLFVKADNAIALNLYKKLGFSFVSMFRIRYYQ